MFSQHQFIRLPQVKELTCLSKSSIYRLIEEGDFPKQIPLGARSVVWVKSHVEDWCSQKVNTALCWVVDKWKQHRSIAGFRTSCGTLLTTEPSVCARRRDTLSVLLPMEDSRGLMSSVGPLEGTTRGMRSGTWISLCGLSLWRTHQGSLYISSSRTSDPRKTPVLGDVRETER